MACFWIFSTEFSEHEDNWISNNDSYKNYPYADLYTLAFYFTVTTITTVGYGDMSGSNTTERIICVLMMVMGVIFFSINSGNITSIITM